MLVVSAIDQDLGVYCALHLQQELYPAVGKSEAWRGLGRGAAVPERAEADIHLVFVEVPGTVVFVHHQVEVGLVVGDREIEAVVTLLLYAVRASEGPFGEPLEVARSAAGLA